MVGVYVCDSGECDCLNRISLHLERPIDKLFIYFHVNMDVNYLPILDNFGYFGWGRYEINGIMVYLFGRNSLAGAGSVVGIFPYLV